jgi:hypothetical protein
VRLTGIPSDETVEELLALAAGLARFPQGGRHNPELQDRPEHEKASACSSSYGSAERYLDFGFAGGRVGARQAHRRMGRRGDRGGGRATNLENRVLKVIGLYYRRMRIEEQFRDAKGARSEVKLRWTQFTHAQ